MFTQEMFKNQKHRFGETRSEHTQDENCMTQAMKGLHEVVESLGWKFALTGSKIQHLYNETAFYICKDRK